MPWKPAKETRVTLSQAAVLGIVQGCTEFLPVSSSAHLVLVPWFLGWAPHELLFDTTVHLGTLTAVVLYFGGDLGRLLQGWVDSLRPQGLVKNPEGLLAWWIILGTIPAALLGYLFHDFFEALFGQPRWIALFLLVTACLLLVCEGLGQRRRDLVQMRSGVALGIGIAQAVAIAPGISRSGATIAAAMLFGLKREASARFSFLLSIPIIFGAGMYQLLKVSRHGIPLNVVMPYMVGFGVAAVVGYLCIHLFLLYLRRNSLYPFALYCALVGVVVLARMLL
jgi:undecaprenyl-diphosphatase